MLRTVAPNPDALLREQLAKRILVLDGSMGVLLQGRGLSEADTRGERFRDHSHDLKGHDGVLVLSRPDITEAVHREYLEAGADLSRRDAEEAGHASELMRTSILASLSNGVAVLDNEGRVISINESWAQFARDGAPWNANAVTGPWGASPRPSPSRSHVPASLQ